MTDAELRRILADARYQALVRRRGRFAGGLSLVLLAAYFGFLLVIAFDRALLARPFGSGVISIAIPVGLGLILLAIALTGAYVRRANREFDALETAIREDVAR